MIALKRQLMQSKLSVLMPRKWGGHRGAEISLGAAPLAPLGTAPVYCSRPKFGRGSYRTVSALQSILCRNDIAGRLWPLNDSEGQSGSPPKWNHLENGPTPTFDKNNVSITFSVRLHTDITTDKPTCSHNIRLGGGKSYIVSYILYTPGGVGVCTEIYTPYLPSS